MTREGRSCLAGARVARPALPKPPNGRYGRMVVPALVTILLTKPDATLPARQGRDLRRVVTIGRKKFMFQSVET